MAELDRYTRHTRALREHELGIVLRYFDRNPSRVLEIGAGSGWHAKLIATHGHSVAAIDTAPWVESAHPVAAYDGDAIPFADASFDVVFSSSVLEHIVDIDKTEREMARVLVESGVAIHIVPTPVWRLLTTLTHYPALPWIIAGVLRQVREGCNRVAHTARAQGAPQQSSGASPSGSAMAARLRRLLRWAGTLAVSPRHGERGTRFTEAWYFRKEWWRRHFQENGFEIIAIEDSGLVYGGNILFGGVLPVGVRRRLAAILGSSSRIFVLKRRG